MNLSPHASPCSRARHLGRSALAAVAILVVGTRATRAQATPTAAASDSLPTVLTLGAAARVAAARGVGAELAALRADGAAARAAQARAGLLPTVGAVMSDGQRTYNTASFGLPFPGFNPNGQVIGPVRTTDVRGRVEATLFAPALRGRYRAATAAATTADAEARAAAEASATVGAMAYLRLLRADAQVQARAADSTLAAELLDIARRQLDAGTGIGLDVTRAQAQAATVRTQLIAARSERDRARLALQRTLALPLDGHITLGDSLTTLAASPMDFGNTGIVPPGTANAPITEGPVLPRMLAAAMAARPDLRAAEEAVQAARRAMAATRAEALPRLAVFGDDGYTSNGYAHLLNTYSYGIALSVPVWEGGRRESRLDEQSAALREAELRLRDLRSQVEADVATALLEYAAAAEQLDASGERLQLAEQEVAQARERFRAGVAGNADVIAAQLALNAARGQHIDVESALVAARVNLARAEGRVTQLP